MRFRRKKEGNALLYVPKIKYNNWEVKGGKVLITLEHNKLVERVVGWLFKKPKVTDIKLDEMGTKVWMCIDGQKNIYDIGNEIKEFFGESCEPVYERLILYIGYLCKKNWVEFVKDTNNNLS